MASESNEPDQSPLLDHLNAQLEGAAELLDRACDFIMDADLNKTENIRRVGEALASIFKIQHQIYDIRPDLPPRFLRGQHDKSE